MSISNDIDRLASFISTNEFNELKSRVHDRLVEILDLSLIDTLEEEVLRQEIRRLTKNILSESEMRTPLNAEERERLYQEIQDETLGLGPIEPFMKDPIRIGYSGEHVQSDLRGASGKALPDGGKIQGRRPPAKDHRPDRVRRRPPHR